MFPRPLAPARQHLIAAATSQLRRRQNVSRACIRCQQKKIKCFGGIPCQRCLETSTPCVVDEDSDERRKILLKRRISYLEKDRELLIQLVDTLRDEDRLHISDTMNLIRSNASIDDLRSFVTDQVEPQGSKESSYSVVKPEADGEDALFPTPSARQHLLNIQRLTDIPVHRVPARPWTSVTDDNDFVSHLISLYFSWEHQTWFSNWPEAMATQDDPTSKGLHFYHEASDLLVLQEGRVSLTSVQGLGALYTRYLRT
ncbi:Zn(II)2Cys6 transcription factor domain-containing protein [Aspergillus melleus]|uniref:Zn(II)2Cys6 transcription factor domain-containing protein n=1 Tax=Aspergillus melleus TaxID=138277 RepID=UPI001E8D7ABA|nr:uncharacterized protein LDX57_008580 [Aspergillus melleus]KAH8430916.1 hypothetical protein LDX57_008580 [Aspergillus melleus]